MAAWRAVGRWIPAALRGLGCALLVLPAACSYLYVAPDGTRHVVGFVHLEIPPGNPAPWGGESLRVRSLGVSVSSSHESHALVLGYSDATTWRCERTRVLRRRWRCRPSRCRL